MNILLGDLHGDYTRLHRYLDRGTLDSTTVYQVGDFGLFNMNRLSQEVLTALNDKLKSHKVKLRVIRGNHDNPMFWNHEKTRKTVNSIYSNIELLPDYHTEVIDGETVLFIGGAVSIDRVRSQNTDSPWWADEVVALPTGGIESLTEVDVVVAHNCPLFFNHGVCGNSNLAYWVKDDPTLLDDLKAERLILNEIFYQVKPHTWYSGHFHNNENGMHEGCRYRCVNINETFQL